MDYVIDIVDRQEQRVAVVRGTADAGRLPEFLGRAFGAVAGFAQRARLPLVGAPFGRYTPRGEGAFDVEAGFPIGGPATSSGDVQVTSLPGGSAAHTIYVGPYEGIADAYEATAAYVRQQGYVENGVPWESYLDDPDVKEPRTEIFFPVRRP
jgi:effector-binding domain-containing protein